MGGETEREQQSKGGPCSAEESAEGKGTLEKKKSALRNFLLVQFVLHSLEPLPPPSLPPTRVCLKRILPFEVKKRGLRWGSPVAAMIVTVMQAVSVCGVVYSL